MFAWYADSFAIIDNGVRTTQDVTMFWLAVDLGQHFVEVVLLAIQLAHHATDRSQ